MKKIILTISFLFLFLPFSVEAFSGSFEITCDDTTLKVGETTSCKIVINSDEEITSLRAVMKMYYNLNYGEMKLDESIWSGESESADGILELLPNDNPKGENIGVATFDVTAKAIATENQTSIDVPMTLTEIEVYSSVDNSEKPGDFKVVPTSIKVTTASTGDSSGNEDDGETGTPIVSNINFTGNEIIKFPAKTDGELSAFDGYDLDDYKLRYQYVGLTNEQDEIIAKAYKDEDLQTLIDNLPSFDTEKWTDVENDYLVPFNEEKSESGNYILYIELVDEDNNVVYAYDYVISSQVVDYTGPSTADSLPLILIAIVALGGLAIYGYRKMQVSV